MPKLKVRKAFFTEDIGNFKPGAQWPMAFQETVNHAPFTLEHTLANIYNLKRLTTLTDKREQPLYLSDTLFALPFIGDLAKETYEQRKEIELDTSLSSSDRFHEITKVRRGLIREYGHALLENVFATSNYGKEEPDFDKLYYALKDEKLSFSRDNHGRCSLMSFIINVTDIDQSKREVGPATYTWYSSVAYALYRCYLAKKGIEKGVREALESSYALTPGCIALLASARSGYGFGDFVNDQRDKGKVLSCYNNLATVYARVFMADPRYGYVPVEEVGQPRVRINIKPRGANASSCPNIQCKAIWIHGERDDFSLEKDTDYEYKKSRVKSNADVFPHKRK